jgi:hypothetical protein
MDGDQVSIDYSAVDPDKKDTLRITVSAVEKQHKELLQTLIKG